MIIVLTMIMIVNMIIRIIVMIIIIIITLVCSSTTSLHLGFKKDQNLNPKLSILTVVSARKPSIWKVRVQRKYESQVVENCNK